MQQRTIGNETVGRVQVGAIGMGVMPLSTKDPRPSADEAVGVVHAALDAGVTLFDTADAYSYDEAEFGHNELLLARALAGRGDDVLVATKGGHTRSGTEWGVDGSAAYLRHAVDGSLQRLGVEAIGLYQYHRPDPATPWADVMGTLRELYDAGKVRMVGISNADVGQIDVAREIVGDALVSVQNQFSPAWNSSLDELRHCAAHGLAWLPWSPFGGVSAAPSLGSSAGEFSAVAGELGVSVYQVTLAWHLAQADVVLPIPGASRADSIRDSAAAADLTLTEDHKRRLDTCLTP
ncbi:aldo/keto reductase [Modestobacter sp. I12A-02628]|uniref:Aldo/keto reductase n=1 Tax=Goekera deserti TaxID=2497753 RepID=A0A7K3WA34_9ACTN|nr:aldo/keto reductase [Goekera deserti]MPQ99169.1 aldo/keto reductase [Goekera deserti]NDI47504.1 aldo/keto reductase [Goekera deserti]NEL53315.1 aldo/keto reductase [Goekera deserti]